MTTRFVEHLGEQGKIEESERLTDEIDRLKRTKEDLIILAENPVLAQKQMKVCEICGSMQAINDTEVRNANHLDGKVHKGFALLRKEIDRLTKRRDMLNLILQNEKRPDRRSRSPKRRSPSRTKSKERRDRKERDSSYQRVKRSRSRSQDKSKLKHKDSKSKRDKKDKEKDKKKKHKHRNSRSGSARKSRDRNLESSHKDRPSDKQKKDKKSKHRRGPSSSVESGELAR